MGKILEPNTVPNGALNGNVWENAIALPLPPQLPLSPSPPNQLKAKFELLTGRTMESIGQSQALDSDFACILSAALANEINFGRRPLCHPVISLHNAIKKANKKYRTKNAFPLAFPHERKKASISRRKKSIRAWGVW